MAQEAVQIYIDRLQGGTAQKLEGVIDPQFLGDEEGVLSFRSPVRVSGEAYVTDEHLVLHLNASTTVHMPCSICNEMTPVKLAIQGLYHTEPLSEIDAVFDAREALRAALLIELPKAVECGGNCPERTFLKPYLRNEAKPDLQYPFSNLKFPQKE